MSALDESTLLTTLEQAGITGAISGVQIKNGSVSFVIEVAPDQGPGIETLRQKAEHAVSKLPGVKKVSAIMTAQRTGGTQKKTARIENLTPTIKHVIAVASGKGGVGKSTVAVNLAVALAGLGYKTGLLDADIYGPSAPTMFGLRGKPALKDDKLQPPEAYGVKVMSIGFLLEDGAPVIWRGPMVQTALRQFLQDVNWGELDILVVDMPPGTGDAQLTMAQKVPLSGAIIVSTPQDIALIDARKGLTMFRQTHVPILGIVENMSVYICPRCAHEEHIFGQQGAENEAKKLGVPFLGAIPLHRAIRETGDSGTPVTAAQPDSPHAQAFRTIAETIAAALKEQAKRVQAS